MLSRFVPLFLTLFISAILTAQQPANRAIERLPATVQQQKSAPTPQQVGVAKRKAFVLDVVRMAVAMPQPDPQDRLRVLSSAADVVSSVSKPMATQLAKQGARLEAELISSGIKPAVSIMASGQVDCTTTANFVEALPASAAQNAEDALLGAISTCPQRATEVARIKLTAALQSGILAPRALMALMERTGPSSEWSQRQFTALFASLPSEAEKSRAEAPNYAAMYSEMAPSVPKDVARKAGLAFLDWLGKLRKGSERNLAVNIATDSMRTVLGDQFYGQALATDPVAQSVASTAGEPGEVEHSEEENVSVLHAMVESGTDQSESLAKLPDSLRARQAAADGFASGTEGHPELARRYFDTAFLSLNEVWTHRSPEKNAAAVVEEVSEAAANVNAIDALQRSRQLQDPTAQAIGMLAVARVVNSQ